MNRRIRSNGAFCIAARKGKKLSGGVIAQIPRCINRNIGGSGRQYSTAVVVGARKLVPLIFLRYYTTSCIAAL